MTRVVLTGLMILDCSSPYLWFYFFFNFCWYISPPQYTSCMCAGGPQVTGRNFKQNWLFPRTQEDLRNSLRWHKHGSGVIMTLLQPSGYLAWCVWDTLVTQWSVIFSYRPVPHLPVVSPFGCLNSSVRSTTMEISEDRAFWRVFYCLVVSIWSLNENSIPFTSLSLCFLQPQCGDTLVMDLPRAGLLSWCFAVI